MAKKEDNRKWIYIFIVVALVGFFFVKNTNTGFTSVDTRYITLASIEDLSIDGNKVALATHEVYIGKDLNNDGDKSDVVLQIYDIESGEVFNTGLSTGATDISISEEIVGMLTHEAYISQDLNNDGDRKDIILRYYDIDSGKLVNTGINTGAKDLSVSGSKVVFLSKEILLNEDLNGDGDRKDRVLRSYDVVSEELSNLEIVV
tara:strand:- start:353 stop:961 length:609 start_codon:yes stop_codon:yes gene_type:complete